MSTIIELKEKSLFNSQTKNHISEYTGDYSCQVGEVTLYKGDQLSIKSAFIDQIGESSNLIEVLPDDDESNTATLTMTFGYYVCDWGGTPTDAVTTPGSEKGAGNSLTRNSFIPVDTRPAVPASGNDPEYPAGQANGQLYIGCNKTEHSTPAQKANISVLNGFDIGLFRSPNSSKSSAQKNIRVGYFKYEDVKSTDAKPIFHYLTIVFRIVENLIAYKSTGGSNRIDNSTVERYIRFDNKDGPSTTKGLSFPIAIRKNSFGVHYNQLNNKTNRKNGTFDHWQRMVDDDHLDLVGVQEADMTAGGTYSLSTFDQQVTIEAKSYDPEELAIAISSAFSMVNNNNLPNHEVKRNFVSTNKLITTTNNFNTNFIDDPQSTPQNPQPIGYSGGAITPVQAEQIFGNFVADDAFQILQIKTINGGTNQFLGTNNFDVHYDGTRFLINQMHTPIFDNNGNNIVISLESKIDKGQGAVVTRRFANKSSGIYITDLQPNYLWFQRMKFSEHIKTQQNGTSILSIPPIAGGTAVDCLLPKVTLIDGVNITGDIVSIGSVMASPSNNEGVDWQDATSFNNRKMIESQTIPILADQFNNPDIEKEKNGYYQLEIDCGINYTDIRGQDSKNNKIKAIVSKFYTDKSYLSTYNEGAIPYIHESDIPITLSNFNVRILDSKGVLASENNQIGDDNTVFMEIVRGQKIEK